MRVYSGVQPMGSRHFKKIISPHFLNPLSSPAHLLSYNQTFEPSGFSLILMTSAIDTDLLISRPLDVIARLRAELKARDTGNNNNTAGSSGEEGALVAQAISEALCSGAAPALDRVPVLTRESLAEVRSDVFLVVLTTEMLCLLRLRGEQLSKITRSPEIAASSAVPIARMANTHITPHHPAAPSCRFRAFFLAL